MNTETAFWQYIFPIGIAYIIAWIIHQFGERISHRIIGLGDYAPQSIRVREERQRTLHDLLSSAISFFAFLTATVFTLGLFIDTTSLIWMLGLFSAAFGLGARPIISDYLTGISFIFGNVLDIGEKVEILEIDGTIEKMSLRAITIRSTMGEAFIVPNGEVRVIRNFSRGRFSLLSVTVKINSMDLDKTIKCLHQLAEESEKLLPDILEPLHLISETGTIDHHSELTLIGKVHFGKAADVRLELMRLIPGRLAENGISLQST